MTEVSNKNENNNMHCVSDATPNTPRLCYSISNADLITLADWFKI